eukprot:TRINITY_DN2032_c0_g3_i1.p1 TRINITY_DN2032_c0_g3~~TRINITY_DN2032_c0_g3_i1.p1  ORF type:complete len:373 (-),score=53.13 TRINITY_DN2032_c0_g3_i1:129-1247(-)
MSSVLVSQDDTGVAVVDGSLMEGGGQVLRVSTAISVLTKRDLRVTRIRGKRSKPGLRAQHQTGIGLLAALASATVDNNHVGSNEITFRHADTTRIRGGNHTCAIGTAGAITLVLQSSLPCLIFAQYPSSLTIRGGTDVAWSPPVAYVAHTLLPLLKNHFNIEATLRVDKRGFFPKGGGTVSIDVTPSETALPPMNLCERGDLTHITGHVTIAGALPPDTGAKIVAAAKKCLRWRLKDMPSLPIDINVVKETRATAQGDGGSIYLCAHTSTGCLLGASALCERKKRAAAVGQEAALSLVDQWSSGGCVDEYMQDQVLIFMALAAGRSQIVVGPITLHTQTAMRLLEELTDAKFTLEELDNKTNRISVDGIGHK